MTYTSLDKVGNCSPAQSEDAFLVWWAKYELPFNEILNPNNDFDIAGLLRGMAYNAYNLGRGWDIKHYKMALDDVLNRLKKRNRKSNNKIKR
jgi:hypothetical protein